MRKTILMLLLASASSNAFAEWVAIGGDEVSTVYVDPATILKIGDKVKMWHLADFNKGQVTATGRQYASQKSQYEYDCKARQARLLTFVSHTRNMGAGAMVEGDWHPLKWEPPAPGSVVDYLRKYACAKR